MESEEPVRARIVDDYASYLRLDLLLDAQQPVSDHHDEMLFIVAQQTTELWFKLIIDELERARRCLAADELGLTRRSLARVSRAERTMVEAWSVLATLTPSDYRQFRPLLGTFSGLESVQFRAIRFLLGLRDRTELDGRPQDEQVFLHRFLISPSLYDEALLLLDRRGLAIPAEVIERDWSEPHVPRPAVVQAWASVYRQVERLWDVYAVAEKLVDVDQAFGAWRHVHRTTVERITGRPSTEPEAGFGYLMGDGATHLFPELWEARSLLSPPAQ